MSMDARLRFTAEPTAQLPFEDDDATQPAAPVMFALARQPDPLDELRAKVERAELLAEQAELNVRIAVARAELASLRSKPVV